MQRRAFIALLGGAVVYTRQAKILLLGLDEAALTQFWSATEPHALLLARGVQERFAAAWGLGETGATGPTGNRYGDPAGHTCFAVAGIAERATLSSTTCPLPNIPCLPAGPWTHNPARGAQAIDLRGKVTWQGRVCCDQRHSS